MAAAAASPAVAEITGGIAGEEITEGTAGKDVVIAGDDRDLAVGVKSAAKIVMKSVAKSALTGTGERFLLVEMTHGGGGVERYMIGTEYELFLFSAGTGSLIRLLFRIRNFPEKWFSVEYLKNEC